MNEFQDVRPASVGKRRSPVRGQIDTGEVQFTPSPPVDNI